MCTYKMQYSVDKGEERMGKMMTMKMKRKAEDSQSPPAAVAATRLSQSLFYLKLSLVSTVKKCHPIKITERRKYINKD